MDSVISDDNSSPVKALSHIDIVNVILKRVEKARDVLGDRDRAVGALVLGGWDMVRLGQFVGSPLLCSEQSRVEFCNICVSNEEIEQIILSCGCGMCRSCWNDYLGYHLNAGALEKMRCMCGKSLIPWSLWVEACKARQVDADALLRESFLLSCKGKNCPSPDCGGAALLRPSSKDDGSNGHSVTCPDCLSMWCFECQTLDHSPLNCFAVPIWMKCVSYVRQEAEIQQEKKKGNAETLIRVFDQISQESFAPCPKCNVTIQKDAGCWHMQCSSCTHNFCWRCFGNWPHEEGKICRPSIEMLSERTRQLSGLGFSEFSDVKLLSKLIGSESDNVTDVSKLRLAMPCLNLEALHFLVQTVRRWAEFIQTPDFARSFDLVALNALRSARRFVAWSFVRHYFGCPSDGIFDNACSSLHELVEGFRPTTKQHQVLCLNGYMERFMNDSLRVRDEEYFCLISQHFDGFDGDKRVCSYCDLGVNEAQFPFHCRLCTKGLDPQAWQCWNCKVLNDSKTSTCNTCRSTRWTDICQACGWIGEEGTLLTQHDCPIFSSPKSSPVRQREVFAVAPLQQQRGPSSLEEAFALACPHASTAQLLRWVQTLSRYGVLSVEDLKFIDEDTFATLIEKCQGELVLVTALKQVKGLKRNAADNKK